MLFKVYIGYRIFIFTNARDAMEFAIAARQRLIDGDESEIKILCELDNKEDQ